VCVYRNALCDRCDADCLQSDTFDARTAAGRDKQPVTTQLASVIEFQE
jgi:hypothetical protein